MTKKTPHDLRTSFLDFFANRGHQKVKSSPLIPNSDSTLMFVNAGMVQFTDLFVGLEKRDYTRATTSQKCMRVSGKHNDLESVGRTTRHHTFFEMLGNFSFGDYFKEDAIDFAWTYLTKEIGLPPERLWVTVFGGGDGLDADHEARQIWKKVSGLGDDRILDMSAKDNFWSMGDTGPCGPCTEIHFDTNPSKSATHDDFENGRIVEIWNNVFMQFDRKADGSLTNLPKPSVDTGMGLERLITVVDGANSNYHTASFSPLLELASEIAQKKYQFSDIEDDVSMRVIADHARATAFLAADGVQPSNEGRGYVMRRIMRRAIRHGHRLGITDLFFHKMCNQVADMMQDAYPELEEARALTTKVAEIEETAFRRTLGSGLKILGDELSKLDENTKELPGNLVFKLYDTYGFPKDLTEIIASEKGLGIDEDGFTEAMKEQQERSRGAAGNDEVKTSIYKDLNQRDGITEFVGYQDEATLLESLPESWRTMPQGGDNYLVTKTSIRSLLHEHAEVSEGEAGQTLELILSPTPFYGESGGQIGDEGALFNADGVLLGKVTTTQKPVDGLHVSTVELTESLKAGDEVYAGYLPSMRREIRSHHSATHLLHDALKNVLGNHVQQAGSMVTHDRLRFDYSHFEAPTNEHLDNVESEVNAIIADAHDVVTEVLPFDEAKAKGAVALFGEKYGDKVRVVSMGPSIEFCGGTHARNTGDIELCLISRDEAIASGVRRIEAEVGNAAQERTRESMKVLTEISRLIASPLTEPLTSDLELPQIAGVIRTLEQFNESNAKVQELGGDADATVYSVTLPESSDTFEYAQAKAINREIQALNLLLNGKVSDEVLESLEATSAPRVLAQMLSASRERQKWLQSKAKEAMGSSAKSFVENAEELNGIKTVLQVLPNVGGKDLRDLAEKVKDHLGSGAMCLIGHDEDKVSFIIAVTKDRSKGLQAGKLVREIAPLFNGKGGGKPEMAQGGGTNVAAIPEALDRIRELISAS